MCYGSARHQYQYNINYLKTYTIHNNKEKKKKTHIIFISSCIQQPSYSVLYNMSIHPYKWRYSS